MSATLLDLLRRAAGEDAVRDGADAALRPGGEAPRAVVTPSSVERLAAVLSACSAEGLRTRIAGGGTWLCTGRRNGRIDVVLSTSRLTGVEVQATDLTASVAAGTPLDALQTTVQPHGLHWPLDPPAGPQATTGGIAATASAGPSRYACGTPRDHVLGLEMLTGDGRALRFGGRVVKNVAGYDLVRLAIGSGGRLGLITRLQLRLRPLPQEEVTAMYAAASPSALIELAMRAGEAWPLAIELLAPPVAHAAVGALQWVLLARCAGNAEFVAEARTRLATLQPGRVRILGPADAGEAWTRLRDAELETTVLIRLTGLPASLPATLATALEITGDDAGRWRIACHAGDGIVRAWRSDAIDAGRAQRLAAAIDRARTEGADAGLRVDVPVTPDGMPAGFQPLPAGSAEQRITKAICAIFDPAGILDPQHEVAA